MDAVLRAAAMYFFLLFVLRITGKRSIGQITTFDFVLLLIIGEASQQAMMGEDNSFTNAFLVILTLVGVEQLLSWGKQRFLLIDRVTQSVPLILVEDGKPLTDRMNRVQVDEADIMQAAREMQGLERMEQIKYAVLERNGGLSIIPKPQNGQA